MSQKLIRLTCESNDGIFNGKFDQDIEIKQGSDIAFQSLTLERSAETLIVNSANQSITFSSTGFPPQSQTAVITDGKYEQADLQLLMTNITNDMNAVCSMTAIDGSSDNLNQMNLQWNASIDENVDKAVIECKRSPFFPISQWNVSEAVYNTAFGSLRNAPVLQGVTDAAEVNQTTERGLARDSAGANGILNESYIFTTIPFIKSTGALRVRLGRMVAGSSDRPAATIGLVDSAGLTKLRNATITIDDLVYAIRVDEPSAIATTGGYSSLHAKGSASFTPFEVGGNLVKPENYAEGNNANDMFEIRIDNGKILGSIFQDTTVKQDLPDATGVTVGENLYPVIFFHMDDDTVALDMTEVSLDPFGDPDDAPNQIIKDNPYKQPLTSTLTGPVPFLIDNLKIATTPQVNLDRTVSAYLGFTNPALVDFAGVDTFVSKGGVLSKQTLSNLELSPQGDEGLYSFEVSFKITSPNVVSNAIDGDSYLVDTQTFQLDSFDSYGLSSLERFANSGGSRRNLLAVIPVVEQDIVNSPNTRIQYEPNTLDYIAIRNKSDVITRQIKMRLLNSRYGSVVTSGLAAMTILVRNPQHMDC
tara:strand:+ start:3211 stop:4974 length:1764 start_codon:yes stop_codon:yes gene_type:complete